MKKIICCLSLSLLIGGCSNTAPLFSKEQLKQATKDINWSESYQPEEWLHHFISSIAFDTAKKLVLRGADVNAKNNEGQTPLHLAAYDFRFDRYDRPTKNIKILLNAKADVNAQDNNGLTPLHYSVKSDDYNTAYQLVQYGADINIADNRGNTPFAMACKNYRFDLMCLLSDTKGSEKVDFINFFKAINHDDISYIKDITKKDIEAFIKRYAISPLILATMLNKVKVAKFLISRGADTRVVCDLPKGYEHLGENNVNVEAYALYKWTPLHIAVNKCWEANYLEYGKTSLE